jgi:cysteine desulfurase/selenocysteine lyase
MLGPTGAGLLYTSPRRAELSEPAVIGSDSVDNSTCPGMSACSAGYMPKLTWATAGTPPIAQVLGWSAAIDYLNDVGMDEIQRHDRALVGRLLERFVPNRRLALFGPNSSTEQVSLVAFNVVGVPSDEVGRILDENYRIAVRAGTHCARGYFMENQPDIEVMGNVRASMYLYTSEADVDRLASAVEEVASALSD